MPGLLWLLAITEYLCSAARWERWKRRHRLVVVAVRWAAMFAGALLAGALLVSLAYAGILLGNQL